jgi:hypothetical protein
MDAFSWRSVFSGREGMKKLKWGQIMLAGFVAGLAFMFIETIYEGMLWLVFRISENRQFQALFPHYDPSGTRFILVNFAILFAEMILIMFLYALIRPRFKTKPGAVLCASGIYWTAVYLIFANHVNLGVLPLSVLWPGIVNNIVELPLSVLIASSMIKDNPQV